MADVLALDTDGRLVVVEMKRDWSDRATVAQLLEYAARMAQSSYDDLETFARTNWRDPNASLLEKFRELTA
jgi:RecB family endonuclease NucS